MPELSFEIKNSKDFFNNLLEEYEDFCKEPTSTRKALNCAMYAWHLIDWIYHEFIHSIGEYNGLGDFQQFIKFRCPALQIMHDLMNGTKHSVLTRHKPEVLKSNLHSGAFGNEL